MKTIVGLLFIYNAIDCYRFYEIAEKWCKMVMVGKTSLCCLMQRTALFFSLLLC